MPEMSRRGVLGGALAMPAAATASRPQGVQEARLAPPEDPTPRAVVYFAPERFDDLMWENDRTAHRIYGPALQSQEPPSGSGIDVWGKKVRWPYMQRMLATGAYHTDHGEGVDFYEVGGTRGAGGLGIWHDNKLWCSRNFSRHRILETGGETARFEVDYAPWPVDIIRTVQETRSFTLPVGSNFTRITSTLTSSSDAPLTVGVGIARRRPTVRPSSVMRDAPSGVLSVWGPPAPQGTIGVTIKVDPAAVAGFAQDADNELILVDVRPGEPFTYYLGAAWDGGLDFPTEAAWRAYTAEQVFPF